MGNFGSLPSRLEQVSTAKFEQVTRPCGENPIELMLGLIDPSVHALFRFGSVLAHPWDPFRVRRPP